MTRNIAESPLWNLMRKPITRRGAGIALGIITAAIGNDNDHTVSADWPESLRTWKDAEGNIHYGIELNAGEGIVMTVPDEIMVFGNRYTLKKPGPIIVAAMSNQDGVLFEAATPQGKLARVKPVISDNREYLLRLDDALRAAEIEYEDLVGWAKRLEEPIPTAGFTIGMGQVLTGRTVWDGSQKDGNAISLDEGLHFNPDMFRVQPVDLNTIGAPKTEAPKVEAPPPPAEEERLPFSAPRPNSLEQPDMGSAVIGNHVKKAWFHGVTVPSLFNAENGWRGAMTWAVSILDGSDDNVTLAPGGDEKNPKIIIVPSGQTEAVVRLGVMTTERYQGRRLMDDLQKSTRTGQLHPAAMWIKTQPGVRIKLFDPASGKLLVDQNGKDLIIATNQNGDAGVLLADTGQFVASWKIPKGSQVEHVVTFGPHDQPGDVNLIDARGAKVKP